MRYLIFILIFTVSAAAANIASHLAENFVKPQAKKDIPFNHRAHKPFIKCDDCHEYMDDGTFSGIPSLDKCLQCHSELNPEKMSGASIKPWNSYAKQNKNVYFSHKVATSARFTDGRHKTGCLLCHGNKEDSWDTSMIMEKLTMNQCMNCHHALNLSRKCMVCH